MLTILCIAIQRVYRWQGAEIYESYSSIWLNYYESRDFESRCNTLIQREKFHRSDSEKVPGNFLTLMKKL